MRIPIPFTCVYSADYVPRRARIPRVGHFRAEEHLAIEKIERSEAECAFRIHKRSDHAGSVVSKVLRYKGQLWWPLIFSDIYTHLKHCTEARLRHELKWVLGDILRQQPHRKWQQRGYYVLPPTIEEVPIRQLIESGFENNFRECERKAGYLLLCSGMAYVAGGEPLYGVTHYGLRIVVAGPDRSADPLSSWIDCDVPYTTGILAGRGGIYPATEFSTAMRALPAGRRRKPPIEICVQDAVGASLFEIQLDALYRVVFSAMRDADSAFGGTVRSRYFYHDFDDEERQRFRERVMKSTVEPLDSPNLTKNRLRILRECLDGGIGSEELAGDLAKFFERRDVQSAMDSCLTAVDEDAIGSLA